MTQMRLKSVRYNARSGTFEARVDVRRGGRTYRYPCEVEAPMTTSPAWVQGRLLLQASRMSEREASLRSVV